MWSVYRDWLLLACATQDGGSYALEPVGPGPRTDVVRAVLKWLKEEKGQAQPRIERADRKIVSEIESVPDLTAEETRDHFDYVYRTEDLIHLSGRRYRDKRNHVNRFHRSYAFTYKPLDQELVRKCLELTERWCEWHRCAQDMNLLGEWAAVRQAMEHFEELQLQGVAILIEGEVEAFAVGELLNRETAVVHIEKANPDIQGIYAAINEQFCEKAWANVPYINREQDLGEPGLRQAKLSYNPARLVPKYTISSAGD